MATVAVKDVVKGYGTLEVIHGVSLEIEDGEFVVLVGPSGCGKSTLLRMIAGLEGISGGTVSIGGRVVNNIPPKNRNIAMVFQSYALYPDKTVAENMGFAMRLARRPKSEIDAAVHAAADILDIRPYLDRYPRQLSGGQRQRVAMGRAIVRDPAVFLFDEPLSNLDAKLRVQMRSEIRSLHQRLGTTMIYVTHDQIEAMTMADRIVVMNNGHIEQVGAPLNLYDDPANVFVASFLGSPSINLVEGMLDAGTFTTTGGATIALPIGFSGQTTRPVLLGIRPEHLTPAATDAGTIAGPILVLEPTGAETQIVIDMAGQPITSVVRGRVATRIGERISLQPDTAKILLFEKDSGQRIGRSASSSKEDTVKTDATMKKRDRSMGAYFGAAIGDAMGGPVECSHFRRIQQECGEIKGLVAYEEPYLLKSFLDRPGGPFHPGYALHPEPGSVTDDTFCRKDITKFLIETPAPRTPELLATWLLKNGELATQWPQIMLPVLKRIENGEVNAAEAGNSAKQGGGIGWWSPFGIIHGGDPQAAAAEARRMCAIWKAPLERDFVAAVVAGVAEGISESATWESVRDEMLGQCGPLARQLLERAVRIAGEATDTWDLARRLYDEVLIAETAHIWDITPEDPPTAADAPMPARRAPLDYTDQPYITFFFAEQIPLALAAFVFAKGEISAIPTCVNLGRDCDTTATTVGALVGALHGESGLPKEWVDAVCDANRGEMDLRALAEQLFLVS